MEGTAFNPSTTALMKNDMNPSFSPFFFVNSSCDFAPQFLHGGHVALIKRGQDRGGVLRHDQPGAAIFRR